MMKRQMTVSPSETARSDTIKVVRIRHCFMNQRSLSRRKVALSLRHEFVSDSMNGAEMDRVSGVGLEFLAKLENLVVDGARSKVETHAPHIVEQFFSRNRPAGVVQEVAENLELMRAQRSQTPP